MTLLADIAQPFNFSWLQRLGVLNGAIGRLPMACAMGGSQLLTFRDPEDD